MLCHPNLLELLKNHRGVAEICLCCPLKCLQSEHTYWEECTCPSQSLAVMATAHALKTCPSICLKIDQIIDQKIDQQLNQQIIDYFLSLFLLHLAFHRLFLVAVDPSTDVQVWQIASKYTLSNNKTSCFMQTNNWGEHERAPLSGTALKLLVCLFICLPGWSPVIRSNAVLNNNIRNHVYSYY